MSKDEIVEEVRRIRDAQAAKFNYDIDAIVADARKRQAESGRKTVSFPPRKPKASRAGKPLIEKA